MQDYIFGDLLKTLRKAKRLSQQALADRLGVHRNTIWSWEQGIYLPDSRGMVLELGRQLGLDEPEIRQLLEASLTTVASYWNVPFVRNPFFTGREQVLSQLQAALSQESCSAALTQSCALHGLGGIGKTQVAVEYAYQHRSEYEAVLWVEAEAPTPLASSFVALADLLALPERVEEKNQSKIAAAVLRWLNRHQGWLLIFDNVEDLVQLKPFLPASGQGTLLLTTRLHTLGTLAQQVEISPMTMDEGVAFLLARTGRRPVREIDGDVDAHELTAARELVAAMGGLPLALDQAGAYIEATGCTLAHYNRLYHEHTALLLHRRGQTGEDHPSSVASTVSFALRRVEAHSSAAAELLRLCAFLAPDAIPQELFLSESKGDAQTALAFDALRWDEALGVLRRYSLITRHTNAGLLSIHRLVQVVIQSQMDQSTYQQWAHEAIETVNRCFPPVELLTTWSQCQRLLPHALACAALIEKEQVISEAAGRLLHRIGAYLLEWAQYAQAASYLTRASLILRQVLGEHHPVVAESLNLLAELAYFQGHYLQAESLHRQALHIREQQLGPRHVETAISLNHLAAACWILGKYRQAEPLYQRALHIREEMLGRDHLDTGETLLNLAALFLDQERYSEAEPLLERSLKIFQHVLGSNHLYLMPICNELGRLSYAQGRYAQAKQFYHQAKTLGEQAQATRHPFYAITLNRLGRLACTQEAWTQAEAWYRQALGIWEGVQGPPKPQAQILHNLAVLSQQLGRTDQALDLYQQALTLCEKALPPNHPDTAGTLHDLAHFHQLQQHDEEARSLYQQALAIRERALGPHHPKTEATRAAYAQLLREMGYEEEAAAVDAQGVQEQERAT
ncbi:MAG TPA: FxSxx-COOH system tetratricopeptide repeat protein [Ktedonobacteraceae bacterium]|nr:FxSxx-COOH system tetratricopeptide repeat protein [Ktedonobacteraceae bacterium]